MKVNNAELPDDLLYTKDNSWVKIEGDIAIIGVTEPAAKQVKEFVFINLPKKGEQILKGSTYVSLESVKWSGHLQSPVSGEIIDVNEALFDEPSKINKDPYGSWIMKVKLSNKDELKDLLSAQQIADMQKK